MVVVAAQFHDADYVRLQLLTMLSEHDRLRTVVTHNFADVAALRASRLLITYTHNVFPDEEGRRALRDFLTSGGRWIALHATSAVTRFVGPEVTVNGLRLPGRTETPDTQGEYMDLLGVRMLSHLPVQSYEVTPSQAGHPLTDKLGSFTVTDEPFILEPRGEIEVLMESRYVGTAPGYVRDSWQEDLVRPQVTLHRVGDGAVLYIAPGHARGRFDLLPYVAEVPPHRGAWESSGFRELVHRSIRWGMGESTLSPGGG
jgi:hypothetical protein